MDCLQSFDRKKPGTGFENNRTTKAGSLVLLKRTFESSKTKD
tara:strand:+ start:159 stop:284 length:126 start_codon:yes stop_codon:yes gene_type:complete